MNSYIKAIGTYLPGAPISNQEFAKKYKNISLDADLIKVLFGSEKRYIAPQEMQCSDLASNAANKILTEQEKKDVDLLIFASASSDLIEPATSNIIQHKLGLTCPTFDVKNACNSFITALEIADAFISKNVYQNILIVSGEKPTDTIYFDAENKEVLKKNLAAISFGDGGSAVLVSATTENKGVLFSKFKTLGEFWDLSTIKGGGSMFPQAANMNYFQGETAKLIHILNTDAAQEFVAECIAASPWEKEEIDLLITHQIAAHFYKSLASAMDFPIEKIHHTFHLFGNTAAVSIPLALKDAIDAGKMKKGDKVMILGVAAGLSIGVVFLTL